ncbi:putative baseplate assembly protein [Streptomyces sp. NPDC054765]
MTPEYDGRTRDEIVADTVAAVRQEVGAWSGQDRTDPGRGLIETCTDMVTALRDRLNRAPDQRRLEMLRRLGVRPYQPAPAQTEVIFQLAAPSPEPVVIPAGTEVATRPVGEEDPVVFSTVAEAVLNPCVLVTAGDFTERRVGGGVLEGTLTELDPSARRVVAPRGLSFAGPQFHLNLPYFGDFPSLAEALEGSGADVPDVPEDPYTLIVLSLPVPSTRVTLDLGIADVRPGQAREETAPVGRWEAWQGTHWSECRVVTDTAAEPDRPGRVTLDVPPTHAPAQLLLHQGPEQDSGTAWRLRDVGLIRYRKSPDQRPLTSVALSPLLTVGVPCVQAQLVQDAVLGIATGATGERFCFAHPPMVRATEPLIVEASAEGRRTERWTYVPALAGSGPEDRHFTLDPRTGEAVFALAVHGARGPRRHGAPLPAGAEIRARRYLTGGGAQGNVPARTITVLRTPLPYISSVSNPAPAVGGTEGESARAYAARLPLGSAVPERAVAPQDYEQLALAASAGMARIHHVPVVADSDALDPARNYEPWIAAKTDIAFTLASGKQTVPAETQVATADGMTVFTTLEEARRTPPCTVGAAVLLSRETTDAREMFRAGNYASDGVVSGTFKEGGGLVLALVEIPEGLDPCNLSLWVEASGDRRTEDRLAVSVFVPKKGRSWWDTGAPCAYASTPVEQVGVGGGGVGRPSASVSAHPVHLGSSPRWQAVVGRQELAKRAQDAIAEKGDNFPATEAAGWIAVQIRDPKGDSTTTYTFHAESGTTEPVPAEQYEDRTESDHRPPEISTGQPGQSFALLDPGIYGDPPAIRVGTEEWHAVTSFAESTRDDKHVVVNATTGQVYFGPKVTGGPSGTSEQYGAVPDQGTSIEAAGDYKVTLGAAGNGVPIGGVCRLKTPDSHVLAVSNTSASHDGRDGYTDTSGGSTQVGVRLMVIPFVTVDERGWFPFHMLTPGRDATDTLRRALRARQPEGVPVWLEQPGYQGIRIEAEVMPADYQTAAERATLAAAAERALYRYFSPVGGGPAGTGWPLGRPVHVGEAFRVLEQVSGVARVATARLIAVDPRSGRELADVSRLDCSPAETVYSVEHRVTVSEVP